MLFVFFTINTSCERAEVPPSGLEPLLFLLGFVSKYLLLNKISPKLILAHYLKTNPVTKGGVVRASNRKTKIFTQKIISRIISVENLSV